MNKDTAKDYLPLVQALAEGKKIQVKIHNCQGDFLRWEDEDNLSFQVPPYHYRIKPEQKKQWYRVGLIIDDTGNWTVTAQNDSDEKEFPNSFGFIRWLTDRIEYELPEGK